MEYNRFSGYEREPIGYSNYRPVAHREVTEKVVYEEDVIGGEGRPHMHNHNHHHHHPETRERVKVVEYEEVPERRMGEVVYEESKNKMIRSGEYYSEVEKESRTVEYPNDAPLSFKKVVYEEKEVEKPHHHHHLFHRHHQQPETRETVKVVEYEQVPERRVGEVVYEENRTVWP
ncbi:unnamed protein product [Sphenostylis stenocarpa]|uniref:Uncharacterized protein n=1 Tax=Sphenostylis stenocarpa TaxID=92480 RepID=A0AA86TED1_9FABA|nr:unnamed protein product [Sphenostylis stenocarpa]